jgi:heme exporter protein C
MTFLAAFVCGLPAPSICSGEARRRSRGRVRAELAVVFGIIVLVTGPLWARKSWGVWWQWDPRVTSTLVLWMIYVSYLLLRRFGGAGSEVLSAAVGLFGTALVPFVYVSVNYWRTIHPNTNVVPSLPKDMLAPFGWCMLAFFLLFTALLIVRVRLEASGRRSRRRMSRSKTRSSWLAHLGDGRPPSPDSHSGRRPGRCRIKRAASCP